jgi:3-oxoacyl-[acyl-carrier protein] reductase
MARTKPDTARKVLVTGGSRGLGLAIAKQLAGAGYDVIAVARRTGKEVTAAIADSGRAGQGTLQFHPFDLGNIEQIPDLVRQLRKEFGPLYALVNNAALGTDGVLATMHNSQIEELVRVNMLSPIVLTKYVARTMMAEGAGRIVNIASIVGFTARLAEEQRRKVVGRSALRRLAGVDDVANAVEYLLGDKARNISGTVLTIDAGATA